jgi:nucleoside-diphosphate-sugar epimerase
MPLALVTGAAGFIGSHLSRALLDDGLRVRGIDSFDPFYPREIKERNLAPLRSRESFEFHEVDLASDDLAAIVDKVDFVLHLAARGGVHASWGTDFPAYLRANLLATQRLLEALRDQPIERLIYASSSSVYGDSRGKSLAEEAPLRPISPYGVTKLAAERLVASYHGAYGLPTASLRFFTVYGPAQRPDMAFHRFIRAILERRPLTVHGDGEQTRDFTNVADIVAACRAALRQGSPGQVYNVGGGSPASLRTVITTLEQITDRRADVQFGPTSPGDPRATGANTARAREELGYEPQIALVDGLREMVVWMESLLAGAD